MVKLASNISSLKRDQYMLSPHVAENQLMVVKLCKDIMIDTIQLVNIEFSVVSSGIFVISVAKIYTTKPAGWTVVGMYLGKNMLHVGAVQVHVHAFG
jgi:hypothetical protein